MTTYIFTKEALINSIKGFPNNKIFLLSNDPSGSFSATGKKGKEIKKISMAFLGSCFRSPDTIGDIIDSQIFGLIVMDKKYISKEDLKSLKDQVKG